MKSQKGVTLVAVVSYMILILIVLATLITIRANYQSNIKNMSKDAINSSEYNKFNLYFLTEVKKEGNSVTEYGENYVVFKFGNRYEYRQSDKAIYMLNGTEIIKIANNIETCIFEKYMQEEKTIIRVTLNIKGITDDKITEYVLGYGNEYINYENEENYIKEGLLFTETGYNDPYLPIGFRYIEGTYNSNPGIIIENTNEIRYVWIPVQDYASYIASIIYTTSNYGVNWADSEHVTTYQTLTPTEISTIYNNLLTSIQTYGGFYKEQYTGADANLHRYSIFFK